MSTKDLYSGTMAGLQRELTDEQCDAAPQTGIHVYHLPMSFFSQKARQALEETERPWTSHVIQLSLHEQYEPDYVRINPRCVVPTLVRDGRVTSDADNIMRFIASAFPETDLVPVAPDEAAAMERFRKLADAIFIEAITYGDVPGLKRPFLMRHHVKDEHPKKLARLDALIEAHADDPLLKEAYEGKRAIMRETVASFHSEDDMTVVMANTECNLDTVQAQLETGPFAEGGWLCSQTFSLADIDWGMLLNRFNFIGLSPRLIEPRPAVSRYLEKIKERPSFKRGVAAWERPITQILIPVLYGRALRGLGLR